MEGSAASATHKMHNLQLVTVFQNCGFPVRSRDNLQVQLHGNAIGLHTELSDQRSHGDAVRQVTRFTIDVESHKKQLANSNWHLVM